MCTCVLIMQAPLTNQNADCSSYFMNFFSSILSAFLVLLTKDNGIVPSGGVDTAAEGGIFDISNSDRLGYSEVS